jgi:hypothetical protein
MYPTEHGEYVVAQILGKRRHKNECQYRILWEGYPEDQATWEPIKHLTKIPDMVWEYNQNHKKRKKKKTKRAVVSYSKGASMPNTSVNLLTQDTVSYCDDDSIEEILGINLNREVVVKLKPKNGYQHEEVYTNVDEIRKKESEYNKLVAYALDNEQYYYLSQL